MIGMMSAAGRDRGRLKQIAQIASKFGLDVLLARLGLEPGANKEGGPDAEAASLPRRTRLALQALGPVYVKLGQILATRGDLLSPEWIAELEHLHNSAGTLSFEALRPSVEAALGEPPETAFADFDPQPLAAASMAQVHRATLHDDRPVVLKIRRPGIREAMEADLRLLGQLAKIVEKASAEARRFGPAAMMRQLAAAILEELDFASEGRNADRLRSDFEKEQRVVIPEIHWSMTSESLLVMDFIDGVRPRDGATLRAAGIDPVAIANLGADIVLDMVLINGRFHGDPHPGNLLCLPGDRIALLDLGMLGHVSPRRREEFISFVQSLNISDPALLADVLQIWSADGGPTPLQLRSAAERLIARHGGGQLVLSAMVGDFLPLMRDEGLTMPPDLLLIFKALVTIDGVLSAIVPDFDLSAAMKRSSLRIVKARLDPQHWTPAVQALAWELGKIADDAPSLIRLLVRRLEAETPARSHVENPVTRDAGARLLATSIFLGCALIAGALYRL